MPPKVMPTIGAVMRNSRAVMPTTTFLELRMAHAGMRYQTVSSRRRAVRLVRRTDHMSIRLPSMLNSAGSTATEITAARTTALIAP